MTEKIIKNLIPASIVIAGALVAGAMFYQEKPKEEPMNNFPSVSEVAEKTVNYINQNLLRGQATVSLVDAVEENGLYKIKFKLGENEISSYTTRDGKLFFPEAINLDEKVANQETPEATPEEPVKTEKDEKTLENFAKCLTEKGAKFYGASWCGHCKDQKNLFGNAAQFLPYIECVDGKTGEMTSECQSAGITGFPTWEFPEKGKMSGYKSLEQLAELSNCPL